jgi:hypothetical protein
MAGLMQGPEQQGQPMPQQPPQEMGAGVAAREQAMQGADQMSDGEQAASPEEQRQYEEFMDKALQLAYGKDAFPAIVQRIQQGENVQEGLAAAVLAIVTKLQGSAESGGVQISPDVLFQGGSDLLADMAESYEKATDTKVSDKELEGALYRAMDLYREQATNSGKLQPEGIMQDFQMLKQADEAGELDSMFPGIESHFAKANEQEGA